MTGSEDWRSIAFYKGGEEFEEIAEKELRRRGYKPIVNEGRKNGGPDLLIGKTTIEVKGSNATTNGRGSRQPVFTFTLYRDNGRSRYIEEDVLILVCNTKPKPAFFIIPSEAIEKKQLSRFTGIRKSIWESGLNLEEPGIG